MSERAILVAPLDICPLLKAPNAGAVIVDNEDHGAPKTMGKYVAVSSMSIRLRAWSKAVPLLPAAS